MGLNFFRKPKLKETTYSFASEPEKRLKIQENSKHVPVQVRKLAQCHGMLIPPQRKLLICALGHI